MFSRKKSDEPSSPETAAPAEEFEPTEPRQVKKGRPTPKRNVAQAANRHPLIPADRKVGAKESRERARVERDREYQALKTGDERYFPARDRGPQRKFVRDYVDARYSVGEFFLPLALVLIIVTLVFGNKAPFIAMLVVLLLYVILFFAIIDMFISWRRMRKRLLVKHDHIERGLAMYAVTRTFQFRRLRMPKPIIKRGEYPH